VQTDESDGKAGNDRRYDQASGSECGLLGLVHESRRIHDPGSSVNHTNDVCRSD
jgi:hypothetical protein